MTTESWFNLFAVDLLIVLMVVLIIFMTATPLHYDLYVDVPESTAARVIFEPGQYVTLLVRSDGLYFNHFLIDANKLRCGLAALAPDAANLRVHVARDVPFGTVRRVVHSAQQAGIRRITFIVRRAPRVVPDEMSPVAY